MLYRISQQCLEKLSNIFERLIKKEVSVLAHKLSTRNAHSSSYLENFL